MIYFFCSYCEAELTDDEVLLNKHSAIVSSRVPGLAWAACKKCRDEASRLIGFINQQVLKTR